VIRIWPISERFRATGLQNAAMRGRSLQPLRNQNCLSLFNEGVGQGTV
jgi:hypothetical protein